MIACDHIHSGVMGSGNEVIDKKREAYEHVDYPYE